METNKSKELTDQELKVSSALELNKIYSKEWAAEVYKNDSEIRMLVITGINRILNACAPINFPKDFKNILAETLLEVLLYEKRERIKDDYLNRSRAE